MAMIEQIEAARDQLDITAKALCQRAGVSEYRYSRSKRGALVLTDQEEDRLTKALLDIRRDRQERSFKLNTIINPDLRRYL